MNTLFWLKGLFVNRMFLKIILLFMVATPCFGSSYVLNMRNSRKYGDVETADSLIQEFLWNEYTNASGQVVDSSVYGNFGYPSVAGNTWNHPTNTMSAYLDQDGGTITSTVTQVKSHAEFWVRTNEVWKYLNGPVTNDVFTNFLSIAGTIVTWSNTTLNGDMDKCRLYTNSIPAQTNYWEDYTNKGLPIVFYDNRETELYAEAGLIVSFEQAIGATGQDHSTNGNNIDAGPGGASYTHESVDGNGLARFDGDDWGTVTNSPELEATNLLSVAFWMNPDGAPTDETPINNTPSTVASGHWAFAYDNSAAGKMRWYVYVAGAGRTATTAAALPSNTWTHVVGVFSGTNGIIYTNGVSSGTFSQTGAMRNTTNNINVGSYSDHVGSSSYSGCLDDIVIYPSRALSAIEVQDLYTGGVLYTP